MPKSKQGSKQDFGDTDFARLDAYQSGREDYAAIPKLGRRWFETAEAGPAEAAVLHLPADLLAAMRAAGPDWEARAVAALRAHFMESDRPLARKASKTAAAAGIVGLIGEVAAPALKNSNLLPQMEQIAKQVAGRMVQDVASRIAREMAQAATSAARDSLANGEPRKVEPEPPAVNTASRNPES